MVSRGAPQGFPGGSERVGNSGFINKKQVVSRHLMVILTWVAVVRDLASAACEHAAVRCGASPAHSEEGTLGQRMHWR
eukprot:15317251-Heterocapsa_arctica.AAC.1